MRTTKYDPNTAASITTLAKRIMETNLCQEIVLKSTYYYSWDNTHAAFNRLPMNKYKFSRAKWYSANLNGDGIWRLGQEYNELIAWCTKHYGSHPKHQDAWSRWWVGIGRIHFRDEKDYVLFCLRWA